MCNSKLMTTVIIVLFSAITIVNAHLCMLSPPQRGSMTEINKPAADDCALMTGPCGGRKAGGSYLGLQAGSKFLVAFQKNLDHFDKTKPGIFNITVSFDDEKTFLPLEKLPDTSDPSLTLYYKNVTMPKQPVNKRGTLRVAYVTDNPQAPPDFYQCSDIMLHK